MLVFETPIWTFLYTVTHDQRLEIHIGHALIDYICVEWTVGNAQVFPFSSISSQLTCSLTIPFQTPHISNLLISLVNKSDPTSKDFQSLDSSKPFLGVFSGRDEPLERG